MSLPTSVSLFFASSSLSCNLNFGADLNALTLDGEEIIVSRGLDEAENPWLFPFPNRLKNGAYRFEGKGYQFEHNDYGRPNALHGFVRACEFELVAKGENEHEAFLTASYHYRGERAAYPFPFILSITYRLLARQLKIEIDLKNAGNGSMPAGLGWHPYFSLTGGLEKASLKLPSCQEIEVDESMIPTGKQSPSACFDSYRNLKGVQLDTCFEVDHKSQQNSTCLKVANGYEIAVWQDSAHGFIQAYTPDDGKSIALEPMTCGIDAFNTGEGLKILEPGENWEVACGVLLI